MEQEKVSLISTLVNFGLAVAKLGMGILIGSLALIADGLHSTLDIFSSFITFLGIKISQKPSDEKHPYGHYRAETLAGLGVCLTLALSAVWIIYEGVIHLFRLEPVHFTLWAIVLLAGTMAVNEGMARLKFYYGRKYDSLSLIADAEHSRADVISSLGVLVGLVLVRYFIYADAVIAILIGVYIIWQSWTIGREVTDSLLDVSNKEIEERIRKICDVHKIEICDLKTRKIGSVNSAEIKISLDPALRIVDVNKITKTLEERLLRNIPELKYLVISVEPHEVKKRIIIPDFGKVLCSSEGGEQIGPQKLGRRTVVPIENGEIAQAFGAKDYMVFDESKEGEIIQKKIIKNPYFEEGVPRGARFVKAVSADRVIAKNIGENAKRNLESFNIEVEIIPKEKKLKDILEKK